MKKKRHFFKIKFWRKGTCHIYFKDKDLWDKFNYEVMKGKNWLPPGTKVSNGEVVEVTDLVTRVNQETTQEKTEEEEKPKALQTEFNLFMDTEQIVALH
jgi:hypothetical protein